MLRVKAASVIQSFYAKFTELRTFNRAVIERARTQALPLHLLIQPGAQGPGPATGLQLSHSRWAEGHPL